MSSIISRPQHKGVAPLISFLRCSDPMPGTGDEEPVRVRPHSPRTTFRPKALPRARGAKQKAAELLGITFRSFRYRLAELGLTGEEETAEETEKELGTLS